LQSNSLNIGPFVNLGEFAFYCTWRYKSC